MLNPNDLAYLAAREKTSREMAAEPGDVSVQIAHTTMADDYAAQIRRIKLAGNS